MSSQNVEIILKSVERLRPMPSNVTRILKEIDKKDVTIDILVGMISLDQVLTALVLQVSNSVSLGYARTCSTLSEAVMFVGLSRLKGILLTSGASGMLNSSLNGYHLGESELWHHSLVTGMAAEWLAQAVNYPNREQAYISGLLHDIGKLLLDQFVATDYQKITMLVEKYHLPLWQVEEKLIGIDHASVGGLIAEHWDFPVVLVDSIRFHHAPSLARINQKLPAIVNLANSFACDYRVTNSTLVSSDIHPESLNILKLSEADVANLKVKMKASGRFPNFANNGQVS